MIHRSDFFPARKGRRDAIVILKRLIQCGIKTHQAVGDKTRNAGVASASGDATRHDLPVAAGGACDDGGANGIRAAAVLSIFPVRQTGRCDGRADCG